MKLTVWQSEAGGGARWEEQPSTESVVNIQTSMPLVSSGLGGAADAVRCSPDTVSRVTRARAIASGLEAMLRALASEMLRQTHFSSRHDTRSPAQPPRAAFHGKHLCRQG